MSALLYRLGRFSYHHRKAVVAATVALIVLVALGALLLGTGTGNNFRIPGTESQQAIDSLKQTFPQVSGATARVVVVAPDGGSVDDAGMVSAIEDFVAEVSGQDGVAAVMSPYDETVSGAINDERTAAIVTVQYSGSLTAMPATARDDLEAASARLSDALGEGAAVSPGGDIFTEIPKLSGVELVGIVLAFVILLLMFRSAIAAAIPLVTAVVGVAFASCTIYAATAAIDVPSVAPLLSIMIGLAVGIDYALFIMSRHVDQLREGMGLEDSVASAVATAGSAVVFAGVTVGIALVGLGVAGIPFLTVMGVCGGWAVVVAVLVALILVPALLGFAGERLRPRVRAAHHRGFYAGWVRATMRHPIVTIALVTVLLVAIAIPAQDLHLILPNNGVNPVGSNSRVTYDLIDEHFGPGYNGPLLVTVNIIGTTDPLGVVDGIADEIAALDGVKAIPLATPNATIDTGIIQVIPETGPADEKTADLVRQIRAMEEHFEDEYGVETAVTGFTAVGIDVSDRLGAALLPFGILVVGFSLIILMIVFRSIAVPLKATLGYLLSVLAAFGSVGAIFIWGWGADAMQVQGVGSVIAFLPIMLMGILFGLAMDYEVFLVSRMREEYVHGATAREAIERGFVGSGPVVTAAALIMLGVFAAFIPSEDFNLKQIAFALAIGVFFDAFLVRMTFVPAALTLLGDSAWKLPRRLDRALPVLDIEGSSLRRVLELAEWPGDDVMLAAAEGLGLATADDRGPLRAPVYSDVSFMLPRGGALIVRGERGAGKTSLLLTIAGRMAPAQGRLKVCGYVLPDEAVRVRPLVGIVRCTAPEGALAQLEEVLGLRPSVVVIDDVDLLAAPDRERLFARCERAAREAAARDAALTLVLSGAGEFDVPAFVLPADVRMVELAAPAAAAPAAAPAAGAPVGAAAAAAGDTPPSNPGRDA